MADEVTNGRRRTVRPSPTRRDIAAVFFRQRRVFVISFVTMLVAAATWAIIGPSYSADMKILVRRGRLDLPMSGTPSATPPRYEVSDEELNSEAELLRETETLRKVVLSTHLDDRVGWARWRTPEYRIQLATARLAQRLKVQPIRKTRLLDVSYRCSDPELAALVLNTLAAAY